MDIDFINNDYRFLLRTSAVLYSSNKTKVVLFRVKGKDYYLLPGGRVNCLEDSKTAIKREMKEELNLDIDFKLKIINENILTDKKIQNIEFVYEGFLKDDEIVCMEDKNQEFIFVDINEIDNYNLKPDSLKNLIRNSNEEIIHNINYEGK